MLVLLPPSEGKAAAPADGNPVDVGASGHPALRAARRRTVAALVRLCSKTSERSVRAALAALGLNDSPAMRAALAANAHLRTAPALPAAELYTGVLYDALDAATLPPAARARADCEVQVASGLWGSVGFGDRVPPYRCPIGARLPGLDPLPAFWRAPLAKALPAAAGSGLVLDLRSSAYAAAWQPSGGTADRTATVRVLHERLVDGVPTRTVVSHFNKATKGRVLRALLVSGAEPKSPADLAAAVRELGWSVETPEPAAPGRPHRLDIVVSEV